MSGMTTDTKQLREQVFRKMGYWNADGLWIDSDDDTSIGIELPPIDSQWEVTAKYLVPFMREKGYEYDISGAGSYFGWEESTYAEIKNDNIAEAACKAFIEVSLD